MKGLTGLPDEEFDFDFDQDLDFDGDEGIEVCCFDNRGMGMSSVPTKKSEYTLAFWNFRCRFYLITNLCTDVYVLLLV